MKKKKLNLTKLQVKSYVTSIDSQTEQTLKGGTGSTTSLIFTTIWSVCEKEDEEKV